MKFSIKLTPESERTIDGLAKAGKIDLRPTMRVIGTGYRKEVKAIFEKQQPRQEGMRWEPLSNDYQWWKSNHYPGMPLLVRTGALKSSMTSDGADGNISIIGKTGAVFGSSITYGIYHDDGGSKIPKRNFSEPSDRRMTIWLVQIERAIRHNFETNGISVSGGIAEISGE